MPNLQPTNLEQSSKRKILCAMQKSSETKPTKIGNAKTETEQTTQNMQVPTQNNNTFTERIRKKKVREHNN